MFCNGMHAFLLHAKSWLMQVCVYRHTDEPDGCSFVTSAVARTILTECERYSLTLNIAHVLNRLFGCWLFLWGKSFKRVTKKKPPYIFLFYIFVWPYSHYIHSVLPCLFLSIVSEWQVKLRHYRLTSRLCRQETSCQCVSPTLLTGSWLPVMDDWYPSCMRAWEIYCCGAFNKKALQVKIILLKSFVKAVSVDLTAHFS